MVQDLSIARAMLPKLTTCLLDPLTAPELLLEKQDGLRVAYAPFDHIETQARLVVVGITPGLTQAINALVAARSHMASGASIEDTLRAAKLTAAFSGGAIRNNLVAMLDCVGVARYFGVSSTAMLFRPGAKDVHFTSALRYPVFIDGKNYNGTPDMIGAPLLRKQVETHLAEEAMMLSHAIWLPLGPKAGAAIDHLVHQNKLDPSRVLSGLPHPSGANAERVAVFLGRKRAEDASRQTDPGPLIAARARLAGQIETLKGALA